MIEVHCEVCSRALVVPGAIVLTPPIGKSVDKWHICVGCFGAFKEQLRELREIKQVSAGK